MAWFNPADLSDLNNEVEKGGGDSGANGENGANGSGAWFNPADLQHQAEGQGGAWFNPADLEGNQQQQPQQSFVQPQNPPQQSFEQIEVEEVVEEVSKETKKGKKKKSKKVDKEKKEQERREKNEQEAKEKEREKKENREAGVDYVDEFHGPWEVSIKMVEATDLAKREDALLSWSSPPNPYVRVKTYAETLRTITIQKTTNPSWNQELKTQIIDPLRKDWTQGIFIEVADSFASGEQGILGNTKICLGDMKHDQDNDMWCILKHQPGVQEIEGRLHMIVRVKGARKVEAGEVIKKTEQVTQVTTPKTPKPTTNEKEKEKKKEAVPEKKKTVGGKKKDKKMKKATKQSFAGERVDSVVYTEALAEEDEPESDKWTYN